MSEKISEMMGRFCFAIFITGLNRPNTGKYDDDDDDDDDKVPVTCVRQMYSSFNLLSDAFVQNMLHLELTLLLPSLYNLSLLQNDTMSQAESQQAFLFTLFTFQTLSESNLPSLT
jgi:hypothetical protein